MQRIFPRLKKHLSNWNEGISLTNDLAKTSGVVSPSPGIYTRNKTYNNQDTTMKTKEIIVTCLVALALLSGCNKEKESTSTSTTSKSVTTPAPAEEPSTTKTQESTTTTTETKGK